MAYETLKGDTHFVAWLTGCFDSRGHISVNNNGRCRLRISFSKQFLGAMARAVFGGSVYKSHINVLGAGYTWEVTGRKDLPELLQALWKYTKVQETPLRMAFLYINEAMPLEQAQEGLKDFYQQYYTRNE